MTERERVFALLNGQTPDQVPWFGDLAYWIPYAIQQGIIDASSAEDGLYQLHRDLGVGFYLQGYFPYRSVAGNVDVTRTKQGRQIITEWSTPVGSLRQVEVELPESYTVAIREHMIKDLNDLATFVYIEEQTKYEPDYALAERRHSLINDNGVVLCYLPKSPYMDLVALKAGIVTVVEMAADEPERFQEYLDRLEICADRAALLALQSPAEFLMIPENISSEVVGKRPYHAYVEQYHRKWFSRIRESGKVSLVHMDGTMRGLLREVSEAGADIMEALTPAPTGDIEVEEMHKWACDSTILWGGIPGACFTDQMSDQAFDTYVTRVLESWRASPRYVLGVADQVPPFSRPERIMRVRTLVDQFGKYAS